MSKYISSRCSHRKIHYLFIPPLILGLCKVINDYSNCGISGIWQIGNAGGITRNQNRKRILINRFSMTAALFWRRMPDGTCTLFDFLKIILFGAEVWVRDNTSRNIKLTAWRCVNKSYNQFEILRCLSLVQCIFSTFTLRLFTTKPLE